MKGCGSICQFQTANTGNGNKEVQLGVVLELSVSVILDRLVELQEGYGTAA